MVADGCPVIGRVTSFGDVKADVKSEVAGLRIVDVGIIFDGAMLLMVVLK